MARFPFGRGVHVYMTDFLPGSARMAKAVIADKNFELAYLYSEYTGGRSTRWRSYAGGQGLRQFKVYLAKPDVTTESFRGVLRFTHMRAFADPLHKGAIDVSACFDNSHSVNTNITTGKVLHDRTPADDHFLRYTDIVSRSGDGSWHVIGDYQNIYYPRVPECKP